MGDDGGHLQPVEMAGILRVRGIGDKAQRVDLPAVQAKPAGVGAIDAIAHLAVPQIGRDIGKVRRRYPVGDAIARPAAVQPQHQPRLFRRAAIAVGIDAEPPVIALQPRRYRLDMGKARIPHQRTIAKHPGIAFVRRAVIEQAVRPALGVGGAEQRRLQEIIVAHDVRHYMECNTAPE